MTGLATCPDPAGGAHRCRRIGGRSGCTGLGCHIDGDRHGDAIVGTKKATYEGSERGAAYCVRGPFSGTVDLSTAYIQFRGESSGDRAGKSVAGGLDVNWDGHDDLLVGASDVDTDAGSNAGAVYLILGR